METAIPNGNDAEVSKDETSSEDSEMSACQFPFGHRTRYLILVLACLCLSSTLSNILTLNFTIICMQGPPEKENETMIKEFFNSSTSRVWTKWLYDVEGTILHYILLGAQVPDTPEKYSYTQSEKSGLFSSVAVGAIITVYPIIWLLHKIGPRRLFTIVGMISAISTALIPMAADQGYHYMLICRALQGVGLAACLPVIGCVTSHWSALKQNAFFIAILSSFLQIAPMFTMPVAGQLCVSDLGWQSVYYLHAGVTGLLFSIFLFFYRNKPRKHVFVTPKELSKIHHGKDAHHHKAEIPYKAIFSTGTIWSIYVAAFGNFMGTQLTLQFTPIYLNKILQIPVESTGFVSAIPPFVMFFVKLAAGLTSDKVTMVTEKTKLRAYNSVALGGMAVFFVLLAVVPPTQTVLSIFLLIASSCCLGFNSGGFFKSAQLVARHHSHVVMGTISFINCICMLLVPTMVDIICPNDRPSEWNVVFIIHSAILLATNIWFCINPGFEPAQWTTSKNTACVIAPCKELPILWSDKNVTLIHQKSMPDLANRYY